MASSKKFTFSFFKIAENVVFLHSQWAIINGKVKHNLTCKT